MVIEASIRINANMDTVWDTFTDLTCWNDWNTVIRDVYSSKKCLSSGGVLSCCFRPFLLPVNVKIEVEEVIPYESIVWSAKKRGLSARNKFSFKKYNGGVKVTSRETFKGFLISFFGLFLPKKRMRTLISTFLQDLKTAAENQLVP